MDRDWHKLFDEVKLRGRYASDAQLAEGLGLTRAQISAWRTGKSDLGTLTKLKILDALGHESLGDVVLGLMPEKNRRELQSQHRMLVERVRAGAASDESRTAAPGDAAQNGEIEQNHLLARFASDELASIRPHVTLVSMQIGDVLYEPGDELTDVYFPTTAVVSIQQAAKRLVPTEVAIIGREGLVGVTACFGMNVMSNRVIAHHAGDAYGVPRDVIMTEFVRGGQLYRVLLHYAQALLAHSAMTAVCNRQHTTTQRISRRVLSLMDRVDSNEIPAPVPTIAETLGIDRLDTKAAMAGLEEAGLVRLGRGRLTVLDRCGIEANACECYAVLRRIT